MQSCEKVDVVRCDSHEAVTRQGLYRVAGDISEVNPLGNTAVWSAHFEAIMARVQEVPASSI